MLTKALSHYMYMLVQEFSYILEGGCQKDGRRVNEFIFQVTYFEGDPRKKVNEFIFQQKLHVAIGRFRFTSLSSFDYFSFSVDICI